MQHEWNTIIRFRDAMPRNTMKSLADLLPPEFAAKVHPDWRKNEADYWVVRDQLIEKYRDQWVAFADGVVIVSGKRAVEVGHAADKITPHAFTTCVGREFEPERFPGFREVK